MMDFINEMRRGAINSCVARYAESVPASNSIVPLDVNSMYPYAMQQKLPVGEYQFLPSTESLQFLDAEKFLKMDLDSDFGYFVKCDIVIPKQLHDAFAELPLFPERV